MRRILAYAPNRGTALRAASETSSYRVVADSEQLERELLTFRPAFVLGDQERSRELVRLVGDRAPVVVVDESASDHVQKVLHALRADPKVEYVASALPPGVMALHDPTTGRLHAARIAQWLGVSLNQFARFLGRSVQTIHKTPAGAGIQASLMVYERIATSLLFMFRTRARARIWLNAPHPDLDDATPMALFARRKPEVVAELLEDALLGHPS